MIAPPRLTSELPDEAAAGGAVALALVRRILETAVACQEAVLQDENQTAVVMGHAVRHALKVHEERLRLIGSPANLLSAVSALVDFAARERDQPLTERMLSGAAAAVASAAPREAALFVIEHTDPCDYTDPCDLQDSLVGWFCQLYAHLDATHPLAGKILRARLAGLDSRTVAERLDLPPRLVRSVLAALGSRHDSARLDSSTLDNSRLNGPRTDPGAAA